MWYWDYTPSSSGPPKPLTKAQIRKLQEAYKKADAISETVRQKEAEEQKQVQADTDHTLNYL